MKNGVKILNREGVILLNESPDRFAEIRLKVDPEAVLYYKNKYPDWEKYLDFILRKLGGAVYSENQRFLPYSWANALGIEETILREELEKMTRIGLIWYRPPIHFPTIRFMRHRHKLSRIELNWHKYNFLKDQANERRDWLLNYVEADKGCRSLLLQRYFGEKTREKCGKCDLCLDNVNRARGSESLKMIQKEIFRLLEQKTWKYKELLPQLENGTSQEQDAVLRSMLDQGKVQMNLSQEITLTGK